jgi:hypothetical protein
MAPAELQQALLVWRAWMDSVAVLQQQQDDADDNNNVDDGQYGDDELAADEAAEGEASTGHASTPFSSARSSRGRPVAIQEHAATPPSAARAGRSALPPHLRGNAAAATRMPVGHSSAATTTGAAASAAAARIDPSVSFWQALTHPLGGFGAAVPIAEETDSGGDSTSRTLPALLARWQQSVPGSFVPSPSERAVMATADMHSARLDTDASSYRSSSSSTASAAASSSERSGSGGGGNNSLRWTQSGALEPLMHAQRALFVAQAHICSYNQFGAGQQGAPHLNRNLSSMCFLLWFFFVVVLCAVALSVWCVCARRAARSSSKRCWTQPNKVVASMLLLKSMVRPMRGQEPSDLRSPFTREAGPWTASTPSSTTDLCSFPLIPLPSLDPLCFLDRLKKKKNEVTIFERGCLEKGKSN